MNLWLLQACLTLENSSGTPETYQTPPSPLLTSLQVNLKMRAEPCMNNVGTSFSELAVFSITRSQGPFLRPRRID